MNGGDFQHFIGEWWKAGLLLVDRHHDLEAAHVGLQDLGDGDTAIGLQMVLEECDEHTRRSHAGVVQSVGQIGLTILALDADVQAAGLCIAQVGARADFEVFLLAGAPCLDVAALDLQVSQVTGAAVQLTDRDLHVAEQLDGVLPELLVPVSALLGTADDDHLLLLELVDAVDATLLDAVSTLLLAEAGAVGSQGQGQSSLIQSLVDEAADHGVLTGADEVEVLALDLVHHGVHLREGHDALHHVAVHHEGRDDIGETLVDHEVAGIGQNSLVQAGDVAQQVVEAIAGHAACGVHINAVEALHDLGMVRDGEIRHDRLTEALSLDVVGVVRADGYAGVDHLGDGVHDLLNAFSQLCLLGFQLCHLVGVSLDSGVVGVDLSLQLSLLGLVVALLQLAEQRTVGLAQLVAGSLQGLDFLQALAVLGVLLDDFVNEGELCILKLLLDVFLDRIRVVADKFDVKHDNSPYTLLLAQGAFPAVPFKGGVPRLGTHF